MENGENSLILYLLFELQQRFGLKYNANKLHNNQSEVAKNGLF